MVVVLVGFAAGSASAERTKLVCDAKTVPSYVESQTPKVKTACYDPFKDAPGVPADVKITAHFAYEASGTVTTVSIVQSNAQQVAECVAGKIRAWTPPCGPGSLDVPFEFKR